MRGNLLYSLVILVAVPFGAVAGSLTDERVITTGTITAHQGGAPWSVTSTTVNPVFIRDSSEDSEIKIYSWAGDLQVSPAANKLVTTIFNPSGSGVNLMLIDLNVYYDTIDSAVFRSEFRRITAHSSGTVFSGSALGKNDTNNINSKAEIRLNNPADMSTTEVSAANGGLIGMPILEIDTRGTQSVDLKNHVGAKIFLSPGEGLQYKWIVDPTVGGRVHWVWEEQ